MIKTFDASLTTPQVLGSMPAPSELQALLPQQVCIYSGSWPTLTADVEEEIEPIALPTGEWVVLAALTNATGTFAIGNTHDDAVEYEGGYDGIDSADIVDTLTGAKQLYLSFTAASAETRTSKWAITFMSKAAFEECVDPKN